jgi:dehydrogenase/reductase SDR family member 1
MPIAAVTGASRGVGKGIAIALAEAGYKVFASGRTIRETTLPPKITRIPCDHTSLQQTDDFFRRIAEENSSLGVLVNSAWGGYEQMVENGKFTWGLPFWEQPEHRWTSMMEAGLHAAFWCSARAARLMVPKRTGLIVNISFWAAQKYVGNTIYGISKAATDKMTADMAHELRPHNVSVVSLYPGMVRTEAVQAAAQQGWLNLDNSESPEYIGRVIAALAADPNIIARSGQALIAASLGAEYNLTDTDGKRPQPLTLATV